jgi:hypothetical protein
VAIVGGVTSGTWSLRQHRIVIRWFGGGQPRQALDDEVARLAAILGRALEPSIETP